MSVSTQIPAGWEPFGNRFSRWFGRTALKLTGWKIEGQLPNESKLMFAVAPHTSNLDFFIGLMVMFQIGFKVNWIAKHSLFKWPIKGLLEHWGGIPVYRHAPKGFVDQVVDQFNSHEKLHIAVAPEGTRSKVGKFKTGFLRIAQGAAIPVLRVGFDYKRKTVVFGDLFYPTGDMEADERACYQYHQRFTAKAPDLY
ncbi:lysophospholipid acyltransferase family protein [Reinekea marinisedimentorum]|uniref:1-acyl-sn-glycerol-3-phosphate acyltransferase n=1 Tax=Reinekea marinisedimentorum TaxID=230495 RepID=A0A4V2UJS9_9GAMM|nr:lysophospholipid acyltransferase family protein [Reinekea marinisedimentorum]TCS41311.1 1-acyl-sn-glycerol-3-phosphate acyltransferase [Reinekea marinisedimentorum]